MVAKKAARKRNDVSVGLDNEFKEAYDKNFNCGSIQMNRILPLTGNQQQCYYCINDPNTNMAFIDGLAGTAKTYLAIYSAIESLVNAQIENVIYIRSVVESSSRSIGALPGELHEKFSPYTMPLVDKMKEILPNHCDTGMLMDKGFVKAIPVNFVRGLTFHKSFVIIDEAQNLNEGELTTILTRFGKDSRYVICGDSMQSDIKDSGFTKIKDKFDTDFSVKNHIHSFKFENDDVVRSPILKHITQVLGV